MSGRRQQIQYVLALEPVERGETPLGGSQGTEPLVAKPAPESPAVTEQLMEQVCNRKNLVRAWKRVRRNQGSPGVDGMTIADAGDYLREPWPSIGLNCSREPTSRSRSNGSKSPSRTAGSESSACLVSSTD
jgi:RNA-directed DNA polymerase